MTISIQVAAAKQLKSAKQALFVSFPYNLDDVAKVKSLPQEDRHYDGSTRSWEMPVRYLNDVVAMFQDREIKLRGPAHTKVDGPAPVIAVAQFGQPDTDGFQYKTKPFDHQVAAFEYAKKHTQFLLGDEQGLGKTKQSIDIAVSRKPQFKHCLIVCGVNGVKLNWVREVRLHSDEQARVLGGRFSTTGKFQDGSNADRLADLNSNLSEFFLVINIEALRVEAIAAKLQEMTKAGVIGMVIVDEIHKAKNPSAQQGKAIHKLSSFYKMALTGTPLMNQPLDLYNTMKWLGAERNSFFAFRNRYCVMGGYGGHEVVGYKNLDELRDRFAKVMLRRKKDEVLNLPPKIRTTEYVEMSTAEWKLYREVLAAIKRDIDKVRVSPNPLAQLIRLRQATGNASLLSTKFAPTDSSKLNRLAEMVEEITANGQKVVVFSNWTDMTDAAQVILKQYNPAVVTGQIQAGAKEQMITKFQGDREKGIAADPDCKVIIGTVGAMGTGLTLTAASYVIFLDKPWNMANTEQAEDRAHRIGTTGTVNVVTLVCKDTIDERIEGIIAKKANMALALVEGNEAALSSLQLTDEEIEELLRD